MTCYDSSGTHALSIAVFWIIENITFQHRKRYHFTIYMPVGYKKHNHFVREVPPGFAVTVPGWGRTNETESPIYWLFLLRHLPLIYPFQKKNREPYTAWQAKIHLYIAIQINFRHAWIDDTINGEFKKLGETGSGRCLYTFFSPLFALSIVVHLQYPMFAAFFRIMCAIEAQHFEPLLYSTVYGLKLENCLYFTFRDSL